MELRAVLVAVLSLLALGANTEKSPPRVIFSAEAAASADIPPPILRYWKPLWSPSAEAVALLETRLAEFLEQNKPEIAHDLTEYGIQFFGITRPTSDPDSTPKRMIHFNAFCKSSWSRSEEEYWREFYVFVLGGGACYFSGNFDPESKRVHQFSINESK